MSIWTKNREFPSSSVPFLRGFADFCSILALIILSLKISGLLPNALNGLILIACIAATIIMLKTKDENIKNILKIFISIMGLIIGRIIVV